VDGRRMGGGCGECGEFHYEQTALVDGSWMAGGRGECGACHYKQQSGHRCDTQFGQHCERRRAKAKTFRREGFRRFLELSLVHPAVLCCHVKSPENCKTEKKALSIHLAGFEPAQGIAYCRWGMTHMHSNLATRTQDPPPGLRVPTKSQIFLLPYILDHGFLS